MIGWSFPSNNGGTIDGFNNGAIDTFAGKRLSSVVREIIQNSLDVQKDESEPVRLSFNLAEINKSDFKGFQEIEPHLKNSYEMAKSQLQSHITDYFKTALDAVQNNSKVQILCVHDYNTTGITGEIDQAYGPYAALIKGTGMSQKTSAGSLGSFGHGSKAPFSYSKIRSVFYYTKIINKNDKIEERFQGKSILQSHKCPYEKDVNTQGTGFYGFKDKLRPLIDADIPPWPKKLREDITHDTGTSIYIPFTQYSTDLYPETRITVIANFFFAIRTGALEVTINDKLINKENVEEWYYECKSLIATEQDEIDVTHIHNCFKSIETVIVPDFSGTVGIRGFGEIQWFLRIDDELEKKVGIARSSGMLITRKAPRLEVFRNVKSFDMFVCVTDEDGSKTLKRLENPTHDNFEFDRITSEIERSEIKSKYNRFQREIRDLINSHAAIETDTEENVSSLSGLFGDVSDEEKSSTEHFERGSKLLVLDGAFRKKIKQGSDNKNQGSEQFGSGFQGGNKIKRKRGGANPDIEGTKVITGSDAGNKIAMGAKFKARNLRVRHNSAQENNAILYFDSPVSGQCHISVSMVGENSSLPVKFIFENKTLSKMLVSLTKGQRSKLDVTFTEAVDYLAIEADITTVEAEE